MSSRAREVDRLVDERGKAKTIVSDNGTELTSNAILRWADDHKVAWHYIAPGRLWFTMKLSRRSNTRSRR
jgi:hypothetical protein